jgi:hypothetical protein
MISYKTLFGAVAVASCIAVPAFAQEMDLPDGMAVHIGRNGHVTMMKPSASIMRHARLLRGDVMIIMGEDHRMYIYNGGPTGRQSPTH